MVLAGPSVGNYLFLMGNLARAPTLQLVIVYMLTRIDFSWPLFSHFFSFFFSVVNVYHRKPAQVKKLLTLSRATSTEKRTGDIIVSSLPIRVSETMRMPPRLLIGQEGAIQVGSLLSKHSLTTCNAAPPATPHRPLNPKWQAGSRNRSNLRLLDPPIHFC